MIDFNAEYRHRRKGFRVIVGEPAWWDTMEANRVVVYKLGAMSGPLHWVMKRSSFERLYEVMRA